MAHEIVGFFRGGFAKCPGDAGDGRGDDGVGGPDATRDNDARRMVETERLGCVRLGLCNGYALHVEGCPRKAGLATDPEPVESGV